jgi:hypothetical protein
MKAYAICKERLDAVQATLGQYLQSKEGVPATASASVVSRPSGKDGRVRGANGEVETSH